MSVTASMVKELRERTGAGMMECKKALVETSGDIELAIENMRKSGAAKAAKKAGRIAAEGLVRVAKGDNCAAIAEINCETDFVARDENFVNFANKVAEVAAAGKIATLEALLEADYDGASVEEARKALVAKIGENIQVRRVTLVEGTNVASYIHGTRIGVLVALEGGSDELGRDIAMHVAANNPQVVSPDDVSQDVLDKEKEIFTAQAIESGKPAEIAEKMVTGRLKKFVNEVSLLGQDFVKDPSIKVEKLLSGEGAKVLSFIRIEVGEGIEKKEEDFAAEVMAQVKGS